MEKTSFFKRPAVQTLLASILCAILGIILGYVILCFMNAEHAAEGMSAILVNFFKYRIASTSTLMKYMGSFLVKAVPVILCAEAILFAYKAGLFNIGVAGQYTVGIIASLYTSLALGWNWFLCVLAAIAAGALWGFLAGLFKAFFNVNEVIAGIMFNWIGLYICNIILGGEKCMNQSKSETYEIRDVNPSGLLPGFMQDVFGGNEYMTIAIPITIILAIVILVVLNKTTFGYELKATGHNKDAAKYSGMNAKRNIILTLVISGAIAGLAAGLYYLTGIEHFKIASSVPGMGFNGIAVAFLGGLHPIGAIIAGLFVEYITLGGQYLNTNYYNPQVADLMISIIIYLCGFVLFFRTILNRPGKVKVNANAEPDNTAKKAEEKEV
ncbi:simple sugar transport system permease protein [Pseudobutyrivibrio sp. YE44]|uniref:ABC transporter permease n=1 Tax=Pseudobutyrivibrio sp. YE44 TaxID=1520802 RepID=UPI0008896B04|nr:ABC transporter permease [Pseudobutyrivibrio sp. YE44]SDB46300.1 simple sugar transport system permease protein [Pseudobutyrivibrio sp. YE44]